MKDFTDECIDQFMLESMNSTEESTEGSTDKSTDQSMDLCTDETTDRCIDQSTALCFYFGLSAVIMWALLVSGRGLEVG